MDRFYRVLNWLYFPRVFNPPLILVPCSFYLFFCFTAVRTVVQLWKRAWPLQEQRQPFINTGYLSYKVLYFSCLQMVHCNFVKGNHPCSAELTSQLECLAKVMHYSICVKDLKPSDDFFDRKDRGGEGESFAMVTALASHQCGVGSHPGVDTICGLSLLLFLSPASRGFFFILVLWFSPLPKNHALKFQSIWNAQTQTRS